MVAAAGCSVPTVTAPRLERIYRQVNERPDVDYAEKCYMGSRGGYDYVCIAVWDFDAEKIMMSNPRRRYYRVPQGQDEDVNRVIQRRFPLTHDPLKWVTVDPVSKFGQIFACR